MMNIFKQLWRSLHSPKSIASYRFAGIGRTILYVFLLSLLASVPAFIQSSSGFSKGAAALEDTIQDLPPFEIANGELQTDRKESAVHEKGHFDVYFDPGETWTANDIELSSDNALAILKKEFVIVADGKAQILSYELIKGFPVTDKDIAAFMDQANSVKSIVVILWCLTTFMAVASWKIIELSFMAFMAKLIASRFYPKLQYRHFWRLMAYSITLPTVFFMLMDFLETDVIGGATVYWGISFAILYLALKEIPKPKQKQQKIVS